MKEHRNIPGWGWGVILVVLAALFLGGFAWRGLRNERALVWEEARLDSENIAAEIERNLTPWPDFSFVEIVPYSTPPVPGTVSFNPNASHSRLRKWVMSSEMTQAGLPVCVLAGLQLLRRTLDEADAINLYENSLIHFPSIITPKVLTELENLVQNQSWAHGPWSGWKDEWEELERGRQAIKQSNRSGWTVSEGKLWWIRQKEGETKYEVCFPDKVERELRSPFMRKKGPRLLFDARLIFGGVSIGFVGQELVTQDLAGATLQVGVKSPSVIEYQWLKRRRWTLRLLGLAGITIGIGLFVMIRGVLKEKKAAHAKSQFVASVTHELRAPVGAMRLMADALQEGRVGEGKVTEFHRLLSRESNRLSVLIENVMDLARVEDGQRVIHREEVLLQELVAEVCEMMELQAKESGVTLLSNGDEQEINADPVALRQILVNLIDNAIKFSPSGGTVEIEWSSGWWLTVSDKGPGIPEKLEGQIFERFFRAEDELRRITKGVGIGLSLVKELVHLHGGEVSVKNDGGAVFKIEFPEQ